MLILAAIPAVCGAIGLSFLGMSVAFVLRMALVQYVAALVGVYVLALIIDALAPSFGGQKDQLRALKVAAYSATASWVVGVFALIPALSILGLLGLYSLYLLYTGLPVLMKAPADRATGYTVVVIVAAIVVFFGIGLVTRSLGMGGMYRVGATSARSMPAARMTATTQTSRVLNDGMHAVMNQINTTTAPFHLSYNAQEKDGPVAMDADLAADKIALALTKNGQTTHDTAAAARMELVMGLLNANITYAFGSVAAQPAGSENVGNVAADKYEVNSNTAAATNQAGFQAASAMLGGKMRLQSVKGEIWIDKTSGRLVKYFLDSQFTDQAGNTWGEHHEMLVSPAT